MVEIEISRTCRARSGRKQKQLNPSQLGFGSTKAKLDLGPLQLVTEHSFESLMDHHIVKRVYYFKYTLRTS